MAHLLPLILILCLLFSGCGKTEAPKEPMKETTAETTAKTTAETTLSSVPGETEEKWDDSLLQEIRRTGDVLSEDREIIFSYDYRVPRILQDTEDARRFNEEILSQLPEEGEPVSWEDITWESHWNGPLLSLVIRFRYPFSPDFSCTVLNYDCEEGRSLSRDQLAQRFSLTPEALTEKLRLTAARFFDQTHRDLDPDYTEGLWDMRAMTISREVLAETPVYAEDGGILKGIFSVSTPTGAGFCMPTLPLLDPEPVKKTVDLPAFTAVLENGKVTVVSHPEGGNTWSLDPAPRDIPIPVDRLWGNYVDIAAGNVAWEFWPVLLLLDENGQISWCDLQSYDGETGSFHGIGPVKCEKPIAEFSQHTFWEAPTLCGLTEEGEVVNIYESLYEASGSLSPYLCATVYESADRIYTLTCPNEDLGYNLMWCAGGGHIASGLIFPAGMDGDGMHYSCSLFTDDVIAYGSACLHFPYMDSRDMPDLHLQNHSENSIPGLPAKGSVSLYWGAP